MQQLCFAPVQVVAAALTWVYTDELDASLDGTRLLQVGSSFACPLNACEGV